MSSMSVQQQQSMLVFLLQFVALALPRQANCAPDLISRLSEQIIVGRPYQDQPGGESEANRIITIDDLGLLSIKNATSASAREFVSPSENFSWHQANKPNQATTAVKFRYPPLGDHSLGSQAHNSFQVDTWPMQVEGDNDRANQQHSDHQTEAQDGIDQPQVEDIRCDNRTLEATIVLPKSFVIEPQFNDLAKDARVIEHCSLVPIKSRLYPTFRLMALDFGLCGVTSARQSGDTSDQSQQMRRRGERRRRRSHHIDHGHAGTSGEQQSVLVHLLNLRFPVVKSLRTNEDAYATLVCEPGLSFEADEDSVSRSAKDQAVHEHEMPEESKWRLSKVLVLEAAGENSTIGNQKRASIETRAIDYTLVGERDATKSQSNSSSVPTTRLEAERQQDEQRQQPQGSRGDDEHASKRNNNEPAGSTINVAVVALELAPPPTAKGKHVTPNVCADKQRAAASANEACASDEKSSSTTTTTTSTSSTTTPRPMPTAPTLPQTTTTTTTQSTLLSSQNVFNVLRRRAPLPPPPPPQPPPQTNAIAQIGQTATGTRQANVERHYRHNYLATAQARNSSSSDDKNTQTLRLGDKKHPYLSLQVPTPMSPSLSENDNNLNLFWLASTCSLLMILLILAVLIEYGLVSMS